MEGSIRSKGREKVRKVKKTRKTGTSPTPHAGSPIKVTTSQEGQDTVEENKVTQPLLQKGVGGQWGGVREVPTTTTLDIPRASVIDGNTVLMNEKSSSRPSSRESVGNQSARQGVARVATSLLNPLGVDRNAIVTRGVTRSLGETDPSTDPNKRTTTTDKGDTSQVGGGDSAITRGGITNAIDNPLTKNNVCQDTVPVLEVDTLATEESTENASGTEKSHVETELGQSHETTVEPTFNPVEGIARAENPDVTSRPFGEGSSEGERIEEEESDSTSPRLQYPDPAGGRLHKVWDEDTGEVARKTNVSKKNKKGAKGQKGKKGPKSADA
jgi:hypothetical protein